MFSVKSINETDFFDYDVDYYKREWIRLMKTFSTGEMQDVAVNLVGHFMEGSGSDYYNTILNKNVENHQSTKDYVEAVSKIFNGFVQENNGDISCIKYNKTDRDNCLMVSKMKYYLENETAEYKVEQPHYEDFFGGLGICIHGLYGNKFEVTSYDLNGKNYKYTLHFTLYDVFGLDSSDLSNRAGGLLPYGTLQGFRCWYILQHFNGFYGKYKPFITYIEFDKTFEGVIE